MLRLAYTATDMYEVTLYIYLRVCVFVCSGELIHVDCGISTDFWEVAEWCAIRTPISCFIAVHTNHPIISRSAYFSCFAFVFVVRERNSSTTINHDCEYILPWRHCRIFNGTIQKYCCCEWKTCCVQWLLFTQPSKRKSGAWNVWLLKYSAESNLRDTGFIRIGIWC